MSSVDTILFLLLAVVVSGSLARLIRLPLPLVQVGLGAVIALSAVPTVALQPELFFLLFLPPLLFLDGWRIPKADLLRDRAMVLELAIGLVILTVLGVGLMIHWMIPAMPLPVAFALAAVISPTDPIAVSAIASRTPIPRRVMHILEGEALLNDASGLVCMRCGGGDAHGDLCDSGRDPDLRLAGCGWDRRGGGSHLGRIGRQGLADAQAGRRHQRPDPHQPPDPFRRLPRRRAPQCSGILAAVARA